MIIQKIQFVQARKARDAYKFSRTVSDHTNDPSRETTDLVYITLNPNEVCMLLAQIKFEDINFYTHRFFWFSYKGQEISE